MRLVWVTLENGDLQAQSVDVQYTIRKCEAHYDIVCESWYGATKTFSTPSLKYAKDLCRNFENRYAKFGEKIFD